MSVKIHPDVQAWYDWKRSPEGQGCLEGSATGTYLENRLWKAFMEGREGAARDFQQSFSTIFDIKPRRDKK